MSEYILCDGRVQPDVTNPENVKDSSILGVFDAISDAHAIRVARRDYGPGPVVLFELTGPKELRHIWTRNQ